MNPHQQEHSYKELREVVISIMLEANDNGVDRFEKLLEKAALELRKQDGLEHPQQHFSYGSAAQLHPNDAELVLEIVWDLFRQGILTLGSNMTSPGWPWLRLSRFGEFALQHGPHRFHNNSGFMKALRSEAADISPDTVVYLREAVTAFYTDCLLSTCVMLEHRRGKRIPETAQRREEQQGLWPILLSYWGWTEHWRQKFRNSRKRYHQYGLFCRNRQPMNWTTT